MERTNEVLLRFLGQRRLERRRAVQVDEHALDFPVGQCGPGRARRRRRRRREREGGREREGVMTLKSLVIIILDFQFCQMPISVGC